MWTCLQNAVKTPFYETGSGYFELLSSTELDATKKTV
jgi:hypothetical protein